MLHRSSSLLTYLTVLLQQFTKNKNEYSPQFTNYKTYLKIVIKIKEQYVRVIYIKKDKCKEDNLLCCL